MLLSLFIIDVSRRVWHLQLMVSTFADVEHCLLPGAGRQPVEHGWDVVSVEGIARAKYVAPDVIMA